MATTTAQLTLSSSDLTSDALSLTKTATLTAAGSSTTGLSETSGIARKKYNADPAVANVVAEADDYDGRQSTQGLPLQHINLPLRSTLS